VSDKFEREIAQFMDEMAAKMYAGTVSDAPPMPPLKVEGLIKTVRDLMIQACRSSVTFVIDLAHEGPMVGYRTETEGQVFEMSYMQAMQVHLHWPLKPHKILSEERAEFVPATQFDRFVPMVLPPPPYEVPPDEKDDFTNSYPAPGDRPKGAG